MDIAVDGRTVWTRWDPAAAAGQVHMAADVRADDVVPDAGGRIAVRVAALGDDDAILQAIEIE